MTVGKDGVFNTLDGRSSMKADNLYFALREFGVTFATGVPCGVLRHIIEHVQGDERVLHVPANRESEAVGIAAGAYLAGKVPFVYMQNSGLFAASNDIASLLIPYCMPIFFAVTYRGCEGEDAVQHLATGKATESLLASFGVPFRVYDGSDIINVVSDLFCEMNKAQLPVFLLLKRGWQL